MKRLGHFFFETEGVSVIIVVFWCSLYAQKFELIIATIGLLACIELIIATTGVDNENLNHLFKYLLRLH